MRKLICFGTLFLVMSAIRLKAQDPHFSQFFMAPQFVNPTLVGSSDADWEIMSNIRQQWGNAGTPFNTQTFAGDIKFFGREYKENTLAAGFTLMSDQSMNGSFRSIYYSNSLAYHTQLNENHRIGLGFQGAYANRSIDYSRLSFGEQFTSGGFDVNLPTGETAIANMKPFFSVGAGMLYNYHTEKINLDLGFAGFHLNAPHQSFLVDGNEILPVRYIGLMNLEYRLNENTVLDLNGCYQRQAKPEYFSIGGALGMNVSQGEGLSVMYAGGWFREGDSFYPYLGWLRGMVQVGLTYDITHSKQNQGPSIPRSFEMSIVIKQNHNREKSGSIPCPWK
jgi:type IX secretion system PorP/SprF family membrane protein